MRAVWIAQQKDSMYGMPQDHRETDSGERSAEGVADREDGGQTAASISRKKRWVFIGMTVVLLFGVIEVMSYAALCFVRAGFTFSAVAREQQTLATSAQSRRTESVVIHPYLGFVRNPETDAGTSLGRQRIPVNQWGFLGPDDRWPQRSDDRLIVGVLGGSVAMQFSILGADELERTLHQYSDLDGRSIQIVRLALSGYKQPQQLMALNYYLAMGGELDVVINLDGFNELALSIAENDVRKVFVGYPRLWDARVREAVDPRDSGAMYELLKARAQRQLAARAIVESPLRRFPSRTLFWLLRDRYLSTQITRLADELSTGDALEGRGFHLTGPPQPYADDAGRNEYLATLWANASRQMHHVCRGNGIAYVHALQPNQYLPDSKPMSDAERRVAISDDQFPRYHQAVPNGYPVLIRHGQQLAADGVAFIDLTQLFQDVLEPVYADACCHFNERGNELLAEAIGKQVARELQHQPSVSARSQGD